MKAVNLNFLLLFTLHSSIPAGTRKDQNHRLDGRLRAPAISTAWCIPPSTVMEDMEAPQKWAPQFSATSAQETCCEVATTCRWTVLSAAAALATAASPTSAATSPWRRWRALRSAARPLPASTRALLMLTTTTTTTTVASPWTRRPSHRSARDERRPDRSSLHHQSPAPPCKNIVSPCLLLPLAATVSVCNIHTKD